MSDTRYFDPRHYGIDPNGPWPEDVPKGQDDSHWRYENDPKGARRAELRVAFCWSLTILASIGLAWVYVAGGQTPVEQAVELLPTEFRLPQLFDPEQLAGL